jgi:hypothetical protein
MEEIVEKIRAILGALGCSVTAVRPAKHGMIVQGTPGGSLDPLAFNAEVLENLHSRGVSDAAVEYVPSNDRLTVYAFDV